jgi:hypothetical protein
MQDLTPEGLSALLKDPNRIHDAERLLADFRPCCRPESQMRLKPSPFEQNVKRVAAPEAFELGELAVAELDR